MSSGAGSLMGFWEREQQNTIYDQEQVPRNEDFQVMLPGIAHGLVVSNNVRSPRQMNAFQTTLQIITKQKGTLISFHYLLIYLVIYLFTHLGATHEGAQIFLLTLFSGITPGGAQRLYPDRWSHATQVPYRLYPFWPQKRTFQPLCLLRPDKEK